MLEKDPDFAEEFKRLFNNADIPEAGYFTPEVIEDTYVDMYISLPIDREGHNFSKVTNIFRMKMVLQ